MGPTAAVIVMGIAIAGVIALRWQITKQERARAAAPEPVPELPQDVEKSA